MSRRTFSLLHSFLLSLLSFICERRKIHFSTCHFTRSSNSAYNLNRILFKLTQSDIAVIAVLPCINVSSNHVTSDWFHFSRVVNFSQPMYIISDVKGNHRNAYSELICLVNKVILPGLCLKLCHLTDPISSCQLVFCVD